MAYQKKQFGVYHKWYMDAAKVYRRILNDEQMGRLFFAVMRYMESGEEEEVAPDIRFPYMDQCSKIDVARSDYEAKCAQNARNGASGGLAKAANQRQGASAVAAQAADKQGPKPFSMGKKDFMDIFKKLKHDGEVDGAPADVTALYEHLKAGGWKERGVPFTDRDQVERYIHFRFLKDALETPSYIIDSLMIGIVNDKRFRPFWYRWQDEPGVSPTFYPTDMGSLLDFFWNEEDYPKDFLYNYNEDDNTFKMWDEKYHSPREVVDMLLDDLFEGKEILNSEG